MGTNTMLNYQNIRQADEGAYTLVTPISAARFMLPYWNPYRADGSLASINDGSWTGQGQNPLEWLANNPLTYKKYKMISTVFADLTLYRNLVFRSQFAVDFLIQQDSVSHSLTMNQILVKARQPEVLQMVWVCILPIH